MMPLLYALARSANGDFEECQKLIQEGNNYKTSLKNKPVTPDSNYQSGAKSPINNNKGNEFKKKLNRKSNFKEEPSDHKLAHNRIWQPFVMHKSMPSRPNGKLSHQKYFSDEENIESDNEEPATKYEEKHKEAYGILKTQSNDEVLNLSMSLRLK